MFNPFDMTQGQTASGMQGFGQQFGLTPDQTRRAMEALLPAFALGLQRDGGQDPAGLLKLFASPLLNQAVIRQAASVSGVGGQALRQMLPMMAGMVVASVVHMLLNQTPPEPAPPPEPANPFLAGQAFWTEMMRGFAAPSAEAAKPAPVKAPVPPPRPAAARTTSAAAPGRPIGEDGAPAAGPARERDVFQQMLLTGAEVQEENVKAMKGIFDAFWTEGTPRDVAEAPGVSNPPRTAAASRPRPDDPSSDPSRTRTASTVRPHPRKPAGGKRD